MKINKLVVYGEKREDAKDGATVYIMGGSDREASGKHEIPIRDNDKLLEFVFDDGSTWMCDASTIHEVYPEADIALKPAGDRDKDSGTYELPAFISASGTERGVFGNIVVRLLKVFAKKAVAKGIGEIAERLEDKNLKNGIGDNADILKDLLKEGAGLFRIGKDFSFNRFDRNRVNKPVFLFIHGTNSDTLGAFYELSKNQAWDTLHQIYGEDVIAFQHRTLTKSPLENVLKLVSMLPNNANLHILSHSRGGIIGDILCKFSSVNGASPVGFSTENIELLEKEGREEDIENIKELHKVFKLKKIKVTKFIRVACPAAGTKLASKRLDQILNAFFNLFGGDVNPFADVLKELLSAAINSKDNVKVLPGLEAQNPDSPFIKILNDGSDAMAIDGGSLAVISGNGTFSFSGKGLMVILGKLFYWQRNDLVVNTDSMYLGAKRKSNIQYFFDQGADVNHVKYFVNNKTCEAIQLALNTQEGMLIPGFKSIAQDAIPASDRDDRGLEHGELFPSKEPPSGKKPILILLPGIMGSNLEDSEKKLWLNYPRAIMGGLLDIKYVDAGNRITARSIIKTSYKKLASRLSATYDVVIYPFDWRKGLNECAAEFNEKIKSLLQFNQPIKIVGHSMGGVLVRDFIVNHDETWQKLNASKGFKLLFLGSPLGGSFRILTVLFGEDSIINSLNMLDMKHTKKELLTMFARFPGILGLLPLTKDEANDFAKPQTWKRMKDAMNDAGWPVPSDKELKDFEIYRDNVLQKRDHIDYSNVVYIAGKDEKTPCAYFIDETLPKKELVFLYTDKGDQSVTWELGIPKQLDKVYYVPVTHGALANEPDIFNGIEEILSSGATTLFRKTREMDRGGERVFRAPVEINFDLSESGLENVIFGINNKKETINSQVPVSVSVSNGDLCYAMYPVFAGHFVNDGILYAERSIDEYLNGVLSAKHQLRLYPGEIGTNEVFSGNRDRNFQGAIVVGLGEPGKLTSFQLAKTVEQGASNYLLSIRDLPAGKSKVGISALIIGCGWGGLSVESSVKAIIEGVNNANEKAISLFKNNCKTIQHIEFIEVYQDKALSCMYVLNKIQNRENASFNINLSSKKIKNLLGFKKRLPLDTSEDWWNRISVKFAEAREDSGEPSCMVFAATTGEAREDENRLYSSTSLIDIFIAEASIQNRWLPSTAKTIFELMIPNEFKEKLKRKGNISWVLDKDTAGYPWELLQDNTVNAKPLCINSGMIRQLVTSDYRLKIKRVAEDKALIIADPVLSGFINQLPGAREEGLVVDDIMNTNNYPHLPLIHKEAADIVRSLFSDDYTIVHLAGHGVHNAKSPKKSGMVIGNDVFLTVFDIEQMTVVPELVFVNCCHLGNINATDEKYYRERYKLAASIGTQLIEIGVKAVVVAGWAVNDKAALEFAKVFYSGMFAGESFGEAVKKARTFIYENFKDNNTWGAYQCYGDPFYKLKVRRQKKTWSPVYIVPEEAETHLENLFNELQMGKKTNRENLDELAIISKAIEEAGVESGGITEKQAVIYQELGMYREAVEKFTLLLGREIASFSFSCMERYCNARAKMYIKEFTTEGTVKTEKQKKDLLGHMQKVIDDLLALNAAGATSERLGLLGSAYKRKAMLESLKKEKEEAYKSAAYYYKKATEVSTGSITYSTTNTIEMEWLLVLGGAAKWGDTFKVNGEKYTLYKENEAKAKLKKLKTDTANLLESAHMDYWDMVATANIDLCFLLIWGNAGNKRNEWDAITKCFENIWKRAGSAGKKAAELEHLQFLTFALSNARNLKTFVNYKKAPLSDEELIENFAVEIDNLRIAYNDLYGSK